MDCKELVYLLGDYIDGSMEEGLRKELDVHISMCDSCLNFLNTYDRTRIICRQIRPEEIPDEFKARLRSFVMRMAQERNKNIEKYVQIARNERRREVMDLIAAIVAHRVSPIAEVLLEAHGNRCDRCGAFLRSLNGGEPGAGADVPPEIVEHLGDIIDALPPGEAFAVP